MASYVKRAYLNPTTDTLEQTESLNCENDSQAVITDLKMNPVGEGNLR